MCMIRTLVAVFSLFGESSESDKTRLMGTGYKADEMQSVER